jgi:hypothetical protein
MSKTKTTNDSIESSNEENVPNVQNPSLSDLQTAHPAFNMSLTDLERCVKEHISA